MRWPWWIATLAMRCHGLFPELTQEALAAAQRILPSVGGIGTGTRAGSDSTSMWSPSVLTIRNEEAAQRNHELPAEQ